MHTITFDGHTIAPEKIVCVGKNYMAHIAEMNSAVPEHMVVFCKPRTAVGDKLQSFSGETLHYEGEISLLICDHVVAGVGFGLDLTKRTAQASLKKAGLPWERCKAFDGSALFSEFVPAPASLDDLRLELSVDGEVRQRGGVHDMLYRPPVILDEILSFMTLADNDIVMTGTPEGVGEVVAGQRFEGRLLDGDRELVNVGWIAQ